MTSKFQLREASMLPEQERHSFFRKAFPGKKPAFLSANASWAYHNSAAIYFVQDEAGTIAGYNALIESHVWLGDKALSCLWLVDIIVLPEYRGQGLQRLLDEAVRDLPQLRLGFPNAVAAPIHKKHGWGVRQEGYKLTLPLSLRVSKRVQYSKKIPGHLGRFVSALVSPVYCLQWSWRARRYQGKQSQRLLQVDAKVLADVFLAHLPDTTLLTSYRDFAFIQWRYLDAPYADELRYYVAGQAESPSLVLITRLMEHHDLRTLRILDIFGNLNDAAAIEDILRLALRDAADDGLEQITVIASHPKLLQVLATLGFWFKQSIDFCWYSTDKNLMEVVGAKQSHWVFADSDFDYP
jgi:GNAT superfamily N-acetyltransferase